MVPINKKNVCHNPMFRVFHFLEHLEVMEWWVLLRVPWKMSAGLLISGDITRRVILVYASQETLININIAE